MQLSYHKFNESQREAVILRRLQEGQTVALISDAGTPGISDPGAELVCFPVQKFCSNYLFTIELLHKKRTSCFISDSSISLIIMIFTLRLISLVSLGNLYRM